MHFLRTIILTVAAAILCGCAGGNRTTLYDNIIPLPQHIETGRGEFPLSVDLTIAYDNGRLEPAAEYLRAALSAFSNVSVSRGGQGNVTLALSESGPDDGGYEMTVTRNGVEITSSTYGGIIAGASTLIQAVELSGGNGLPAVKIKDEPEYQWRGIMLDVARHFFDAAEVKQLLDWMALYKFNKFHWHLTDDQGWRIELDAYPVLARRGGFRTPDKNDRECLRRAAEEDNPHYLLPADRTRIEGRDTIYGGYYTKDEIREVVAYAAGLGIDVIPEVDMPGHSMRTLLYYPELSCFGTAGWGRDFSTPLCPGKDATLEFAKNVWNEVFKLFPYEYVHIGGDEVEKDNWRKCPHCRARMEEHGLEDVEQLQSWFIGYMEDFFTANGRKMIGWDEMLDGGLSETATVLWWRPWVPDAVDRATGQGNDVILMPNEYLYFDNKQDRNTLLKTYNNDIVPPGLSPEQKELILGIQGNLWTEFVPSFERAQYMYFPRFLAVSELCWNSIERKDSDAFVKRVNSHYPLLDRRGIKYRLPDFDNIYDRNVFLREEGAVAAPTLPVDGITVRYTEDGTFPHSGSPLYTEPVLFDTDRVLMFRTFYQDGSPGDITVAPFFGVEPWEAVTADGETRPGLDAALYAYQGLTSRDIITSPFVGDFVTDKVDIPAHAELPIGIIYTGYIDIPEDGIYTFYLNSDDGSMLYIHEQVVIDNDGMHSILKKTGQAALRKGLHPIEVRYFDPNGGSVEMGIVDSGRRVEMDSSWFCR